MTDHDAAPRPAAARHDRPMRDPRGRRVTAAAMRERIYATFTGLALMTIYARDPEHVTIAEAFLGLLAGIVGITLAAFVADLISHLIVAGRWPDRAELREMASASLGAIGTASIPLLALGLGWLGWVSVPLALTIGVVAYLVSLGAIALLAMRRTGLRPLQQLLALLVVLALGGLAVTVLILAH